MLRLRAHRLPVVFQSVSVYIVALHLFPIFYISVTSSRSNRAQLRSPYILSITLFQFVLRAMRGARRATQHLMVALLPPLCSTYHRLSSALYLVSSHRLVFFALIYTNTYSITAYRYSIHISHFIRTSHRLSIVPCSLSLCFRTLLRSPSLHSFPLVVHCSSIILYVYSIEVQTIHSRSLDSVNA